MKDNRQKSRDVTPNRVDSSSKLDTTTSTSEHPARKQSLRFTSTDPTTWESHQKYEKRNTDPLAGSRTETPSPSDDQRSQATLPPIIERSRKLLVKSWIERKISQLTKNDEMPIDERRSTLEISIGRLQIKGEQEFATEIMNDELIPIEQRELEESTKYMPAPERRQKWNEWIDILPESRKEWGRSIANKFLIPKERNYLENKAKRGVPILKLRPEWERWINKDLPENYRLAETVRMNAVLILREVKTMIATTKDMPNDERKLELERLINHLPDEHDQKIATQLMDYLCPLK